MAEDEGFEPPDPFESMVFKTTAFDHSANLPKARRIIKTMRDYQHFFHFELNKRGRSNLLLQVMKAFGL